MNPFAQTAVEVTKGPDHVDIWVDANNNGVRDDDDVNIFVTKSGGFYAESPCLKQKFDQVLRERVREAALALMSGADLPTTHEEQILRDLALELVVKAMQPAAEEQLRELPPLPTKSMDA